MRWRNLAWLVLILGAPAVAQPVVNSPAPEGVAVTIYRAEDRGPETAMRLNWLEGYALVTEKRTVTIPAGRAVIRFEGVAGGLLPESAIVTGLPAGVREKNLDADLLSPRSLYARSWGRPVMLRRTNRVTGVVREERAILRSGPDGAAILQTRDGFEAVNCGPLLEEPVYEGLPAGLVARPTLSIETESPQAATVTLSLSYLAWGFDWQANYVAEMQPGGTRADITAWVTLANSDPTSFVDADMAVVGGKVNREDRREYQRPVLQRLDLRCFYRPPPAPPAPPAPAYAPESEDEIVVTGFRASLQRVSGVSIAMVGEDLGDLKLYRMPIATTVASNAQKQVAMYVKPNVKAKILYTADVEAESPGNAQVWQVLRMRNKREDGLGVALPAGPVAIFEPLGETSALSGLGSMADKAIGEEVDVRVSNEASLAVNASGNEPGEIKDWDGYELLITNDHPWPVRFEASIDYAQSEYRLTKVSAKLGRKNGRPLWSVQVPANGSKTLRYRLTRIAGD